jgi:hypothetical protein
VHVARESVGEIVTRIVCLALVLLLTACVPIGFRAQNLPYASVNLSR